MKTYENFSNSSLGSEEEKTYLNKIFKHHYSKKYKEKYASILEEKYQITREEDKKNSKDKSTKIWKLSKYVLGAAACILVLVFAWPSINDSNPNTLAQLVQEHSSKDFLRNREVKRGSNMDSEFRVTAIQLYNDKKYKEALESYNSVENLNNEDQFWMAMATFYSKEYISSENLFKDLMGTNELKYQDEVKWYYALSLLQNGKNKEAKQVLSQLNRWKSKEAKELIKILE